MHLSVICLPVSISDGWSWNGSLGRLLLPRAVRHNSSSGETIVDTLAVLRGIYVHESHTRCFPLASCRTTHEHRMQKQVINSGTVIATAGTERNCAVKSSGTPGSCRSVLLVLSDTREYGDTCEHGATCSCDISHWTSTWRRLSGERRNECASCRPPPTPSVVVPAGTRLRVRLTQQLGSKLSEEGQRFDAALSSPVVVKGASVIPAGTSVVGTVVEAHPSGRFKGGASLVVELNSIRLNGRTYPIRTTQYSTRVERQRKTHSRLHWRRRCWRSSDRRNRRRRKGCLNRRSNRRRCGYSRRGDR